MALQLATRPEVPEEPRPCGLQLGPRRELGAFHAPGWVAIEPLWGPAGLEVRLVPLDPGIAPTPALRLGAAAPPCRGGRRRGRAGGRFRLELRVRGRPIPEEALRLHPAIRQGRAAGWVILGPGLALRLTGAEPAAQPAAGGPKQG